VRAIIVPQHKLMSRRQPSSNMCFVCGVQNPFGLRLAFDDEGAAEVGCTLSIPEHFQGYPGMAHGGVVAAVLDELCGRTLMVADPAHFTFTAKLEVRYRSPVPVGVALRGRGWLVRQRGRSTKACAELQLPGGGIAAEAEALLMDVPAEQQLVGAPADLGWFVREA